MTTSVMRKKADPTVEIELGGKKRKLVFDLNAFSLLEEATGKNMLAGELFVKPSLTDIVKFIWAGLQHHEEGITRKEIGKMAGVEDIPRFMEAIQAAFGNAAVPSESLSKKNPSEDGQQSEVAQPQNQ